MPYHFPILLTEKDERVPDVISYASLHDAEDDLEEFDVENGEYSVWDAEGNSLELRVETREGRWLTIAPSGENDLEGLRLAIRRYAEAIGVPMEEIQQYQPAEALSRIEEVRGRKDREQRRVRRWYQFWRRH